MADAPTEWQKRRAAVDAAQGKTVKAKPKAKAQAKQKAKKAGE